MQCTVHTDRLPYAGAVRARFLRFRRGVAPVVAVLAMLGILLAPASATAPAADQPLVVLIGIADASWSEVDQDRTPALYGLLADATGSLVRRAEYAVTCPVDGWLTVSAGARVSAPRAPGATACPPLLAGRAGEPGVPAWARTWSGYRQAAQQSRYDATPGALGTLTSAAGIPVAGIGPGARLAISREDGTPAGPWTAAGHDIGAQTGAAARRLAGGGVLVIDLGADGQVDARLGEVLAALPADADVIVASLGGATSTPASRRTVDARLGVLARTGPGNDGPAALSSAATRQPGLAQTPDLTVTVLGSAGAQVPAALAGSPLTADPATDDPARRLRQLRDTGAAAHATTWVVAPVVAVIYGPALLMLGWWAVRGSRPRWTASALGVLALVPAGTFAANLVPWWRMPPVAGALLALAVATGVLGGLGWVLLRAAWADRSGKLGSIGKFGWIGKLGWMGGLGWVGPAGMLTVAVIGLDLISGSRLQLSSLIGVQPLLGGRFYGLGNPAFAIFATGTLMLGTVAGQRLPARQAAAAVAAVGVLAVIVDAAPGWGSDFGGPLALVPAVAVLAMRFGRFRLNVSRWAMIAAGTAGFTILVAILDWLRPPAQRTHLGRVVQTTLDGGLWPVIVRKLSTNWELLTVSPLNLLIPPVAAYSATPALAHLGLAWVVCMGIASLVNDSGVVVAVTGGLVLLPALISRLVERSTSARPGPAARRPSPATPPAPRRPGRPG